MKKNKLKLAQKGGMMIEALAMLGLIAVVTPTMYKKSAERTLEVEDINTATTMRSVMTAADSYVSSHYGELIQEISANETNNKSKTLDLEDDLKPYLPYGFNADKLYDFGEPQVSVVRNGNNLTAFVLFPAKEDGENGLGQERTVRIATLVGANGGYVNGDQTAKGIGGIWNLSKDDFQTVFGSTDETKPEVYSIVTASSDAINNTNTEEDTDKFLYRTDANGIWHNTMHADLYMGGNQVDADAYYKDGNKSIRNIKSLIVGTDKDPVGEDEDFDQGSRERYGLYIADNDYAESAYISGFLKAADETFLASRDFLTYKPVNTDSEINFAINNDGLFLDTKDITALSVSSSGEMYNGGHVVQLADGLRNDKGSSGNIDLGNGAIHAETYGNSWDNVFVSLADENIFRINQNIDGKGVINNGKYGNDAVEIASGGIQGDSEGWNKTISYNNSPVFPVRVGSNAKVEGILATAQLDTQNIRAATLEVGSNNIDDEDKWLKVDAKGIHGSHVDNDNNNAVFEVHKNFATMGVGDEDVTKGLTFSESDTGKRSFLFVGKDRGVDLASTQKIDIYTRGSNGSAPEININTDVVQEKLVGKDVIFSSKEAANTESTNVKIQKTNFEVSDENDKRVFAVRGNTKSEDDKLKSTIDFDVAVHGDTVFTPQEASKAYLTVGNEYAYGPDDTGVAISKSSDDGISNAMYIDVGSNSVSRNRPGNEVKDENQWNMNDTYYAPGTVYVRKGMVEVLPDIPSTTKTGALEGKGVVAAGRFVANNLDKDGNDVKVPEFFTGNDYTDYNGASSTRYDTYMVNPAYTSVMHDIKLTTRGGARLSDILPDFINKGIYITSNTYQDNIKKMSFKFDSSSKKVVPAGTGDTATPLSGSIVLGNSDSWASPYLGFVPAPQCPPGYNRVITMAPQSFMMAQAGQMQKGTNPREAAYYVKNQVPDSTAFDHYTDTVTQNGAYVQQAFVAPSVSENSEVTTGGTANTQGKKITGANGSTTAEYFLASFGDQTVPLTIQQSTWLKTNVIPVDNTGSSYSVGDTNSGHTVGWAALMGFVYDAATYMPVLEKLAGDSVIDGNITGSKKDKLIQYNDGNNNVYWNVFPVRRNTLEAYATTYCYFDRNNIGNNWSTSSDFTSDKYIDHYNALNDYKGNNTYDKHRDKDDDKGIKGNSGYLERLNDPTLKYDEVW